MKIPVVDEDDVLIAFKERNELAPGDIHRVSALWLTNSRGEVLMAQRALTKKNSPGKWGPAAAGTVEEGETYDENIIKEVREELGIQVAIEDLVKGPKLLVGIETRRFFDQWYLHKLDIPAEELVIPPEEVAEVRWVGKEKLTTWYAERPEEFTSNASQWLPLLLSLS